MWPLDSPVYPFIIGAVSAVGVAAFTSHPLRIVGISLIIYGITMMLQSMSGQ